MMKNSENNGMEEIGLVTPTPGQVTVNYLEHYWFKSMNCRLFDTTPFLTNADSSQGRAVQFNFFGLVLESQVLCEWAFSLLETGLLGQNPRHARENDLCPFDSNSPPRACA